MIKNNHWYFQTNLLNSQSIISKYLRMKNIKSTILIILISAICPLHLLAQYSYAIQLTYPGSCTSIEIPYFNSDLLKSTHKDQMATWPKAFENNPSFKNMRGVCVEDINGDNADDIIFASNSKIYAYSADGTELWQADLQGTAIYPPAIADINDDGFVEIVQVTGGVPANGHIHVFTNTGEMLSGWPISLNDNWIICAPALADLNKDKQLEIIVSERASPGKLHVLNNDGTNYSDNFPVELDGYPGVTPAIAYDYKNRNILQNKGLVDSLIIMCSTSSLFAFNSQGEILDGFPIENDNTKFSYQSPLICSEDFSSSATEIDFSIIGATHGDQPELYSIGEDGEYTNGNWPNPTVDDSWTYGAPLAIGLDQTFDFFMFSQPGANGTDIYPTLHAFTPEGEYIDGFPFERTDGLEGFITAMYSEDLEKIYIFTGSNMKDESGNGFIHAYSANTDLSNFTEIDGFPIAVQGFTFMNGVNLGDVNNNGKLDLIVLSYDLDMEDTDSLHINIFEMDNINYNPEYAITTYRANNLRNGFVTPFGLDTGIENTNNNTDISVFPNPCEDYVCIKSDDKFTAQLYNLNGVLIETKSNCEKKCIFELENLSKGMYFVKVYNDNKIHSFKVIKLNK